MSGSATGAGGHGEVEKIPVERGQVAAVGLAPNMASQSSSRACEFFPPSFPPLVRERQVQQFDGAVEGLLAALRIFPIPTGGARHIAADIGKLLHERQRVSASGSELFVNGAMASG